ncbi:MAG: single-stranded-DNA-specific exonuclease RecJ [bacterium]|nr:single-stranded-DNA-specific exonuclease RecJ [bacterium]
MKSIWTVAPKAPSEFFNELQDASPLIPQLLWNRGIRNAEDAENFLNPSIDRDLHDPFLFSDMQKAVSRVYTAFANKEKIVIWGDYDCDGVCGSAILFTVFRDLGYEHLLNVHIPDRNKEGYGLSMMHLEELCEEGAKLIITVDCGITDVQEIAWANERGIDVIIADHHSVPAKLPPAYAILNPKDPGSGYPFSGLAGTGVAFKLACALLSHTNTASSPINYKLKAISFLDLVALATLADSMPLKNENRAMVREGLDVLAKTQRPGLRALIEFCELKEGFSVRDVHFSLIPRLNAMGRMAHASISFRLLTTDREEEIPLLIRHLDERNRERQLVTEIIVAEVLERVSKYSQKPAVVFESSSSWVPGVLGLAAQRVMQEVARPVILAVENEEGGRVVGNARAFGAFNIVETVHAHSELFSDAGGHPHAGGFTTKPEHLDRVREIFLRAGEKVLRTEGASAQEDALVVDAELSHVDINEKTYATVQRLAPFGEDNIEPKFLLRGLAIAYVRAVGNGERHLKLRLLSSARSSRPASNIEAIGFGLGGRIKELSRGSTVDVIAKLSQNFWNGRDAIELQLVDLDPGSRTP